MKDVRVEIGWYHSPALMYPFRHKSAHSGGQIFKELYKVKRQVRTLCAPVLFGLAPKFEKILLKLQEYG